jgi:hypothetical protein
LLWPLFCFCALLFAGCHTTEKSAEEKPTSSAWASVQIHGNTPGQISQVTSEVFKEHGFTRGGQPKGGLVFEKEASKFSNLAYGNWIGDVPVWTRVKVSIVPAGEATYSLECTAYNVRDKGGATEEEIKMHMGKGTYQKLLDEIAARFKK